MDIELITERLRIFYRQHNRLPSYGEMCSLLHYKSKGATRYVVQKLIEKGVLEKDETGALIPKNLLSIPHYGVIKAGYPIAVDTTNGNCLKLYDIFNFSLSTFALTVKGDSMCDAGIQDGDLVIVEKKNDIRNNDIVAAMVDGEWTIKYFQKTNGKVSLVPANKSYTTIYPTYDLQIGGVVIHVIRTYH